MPGYCLYHSGYFKGKPFCYPNRKLLTGKFGFDTATFCGPPCAKGYLDVVFQGSPQLMTWLHLYVHRDLGIREPIPTAPNPRLMKKFRNDGKGLSEEEFLQFENSHKLVEKINHIPIDLRVWEQETQTNCEEPFHEVIRKNKIVADMLFKEHVEAGHPIPKTLLNDAANAKIKEKEKSTKRKRTTEDILDDIEVQEIEDQEEQQEEEQEEEQEQEEQEEEEEKEEEDQDEKEEEEEEEEPKEQEEQEEQEEEDEQEEECKTKHVKAPTIRSSRLGILAPSVTKRRKH